MTRHLPKLLGLVAIAGGIYLTAGDQLTGQASPSAAGTNLEHLGTDVDPGMLEQLDQLVATAPGGDRTTIVAEWADKASPAALRTVAEHFRDTGCWQPGSVFEAEVLGHLTLRNTTPIQRRVAAALFIDAAIQVAEMPPMSQAKAGASDPTSQEKSADVKPEDVVAAAKGEDAVDAVGKLPAPALKEAEHAQACASQALAGAGAAMMAGVVDLPALFDAVMTMARALDPKHPLAGDFVEVAGIAASGLQGAPAVKGTEVVEKTEAAGGDTEMAKEGMTAGAGIDARIESFVELAQNPQLGAPVRLAACRWATTLKVPTAKLKGDRDMSALAPLLPCLVKAGDSLAVMEAFKGRDMDLRLDASLMRATMHQSALTAEEFGEILDRVYPGSADVEPGSIAGSSIRLRAAELRRMSNDLRGKENSEDLEAALEAYLEKRPELKVPELRPGVGGDLAEVSEKPELIAGKAGEAAADGKELPKDALDKIADVPGGGLTLVGHVMPPIGAFDFCDIMLKPGNIDEQMTKVQGEMTNAILCLEKGTYTGNMHITVEGLRVLGLEPGEVKIEGNLIIEKPSAISGLTIEGTFVATPLAAGSFFSHTEFRNGGYSMANAISFVGSRTFPGKPIRIPGANLDLMVAKKVLPPGAVLHDFPMVWELSGSALLKQASLLVDPRL